MNKQIFWLAYAFIILSHPSAMSCKKSEANPLPSPTTTITPTEATKVSIIYLDDIVPSKDGSLDCSDAINNTINVARNINDGTLILLGNPKSTYLIQKTIDLTGIIGLTIDFNFALLKDNVQGNIPQSANRANHTFKIYNSKNIKVERANIELLNSRANNLAVPTCVFWIGGQYLGGEMTDNISIKDITATKGLPGSMFIGALGELGGLEVKNINLYGDFYYGINLEYGLAPSDPNINPTLTNGRHPYNIQIENFNGYDLKNCMGFLRTAATYNVTFKNCIGYNVKNFIYAYCGDRDISRVSQNVRFINCKSKIDPTALNAINYGISIIVPNKDGSTGTPLPKWTNYNQFFTFENCEIWNNSTSESACIRFFGTQGIAEFKNCIFKNSFYGIRGGKGATTNPSYLSNFSLTFENCVFTENYRDVYLHDINGTTFANCKFLAQKSSSNLSQIHIGEKATNTHFSSCYFEGQHNNLYLTNSSTSENTVINYCNFKNSSSDSKSIFLEASAIGQGNSTNGQLMDVTTLSSKKIKGESETETRNMNNAGEAYDYSVITHALLSSNLSTRILTQILNGKTGNTLTITGITTDANLTIINNSPNASNTNKIYTKSGTDISLSGIQHLEFIKSEIGWIQK